MDINSDSFKKLTLLQAWQTLADVAKDDINKMVNVEEAAKLLPLLQTTINLMIDDVVPYVSKHIDDQHRAALQSWNDILHYDCQVSAWLYNSSVRDIRNNDGNVNERILGSLIAVVRLLSGVVLDYFENVGQLLTAMTGNDDFVQAAKQMGSDYDDA